MIPGLSKSKLRVVIKLRTLLGSAIWPPDVNVLGIKLMTSLGKPLALVSPLRSTGSMLKSAKTLSSPCGRK